MPHILLYVCVRLSDSEATFHILLPKRPCSRRDVLSVSQGMCTPLLHYLFLLITIMNQKKFVKRKNGKRRLPGSSLRFLFKQPVFPAKLLPHLIILYGAF